MGWYATLLQSSPGVTQMALADSNKPDTDRAIVDGGQESTPPAAYTNIYLRSLE